MTMRQEGLSASAPSSSVSTADEDIIVISPHVNSVDAQGGSCVYQLEANHPATSLVYRRIFDIELSTDTVRGFILGHDKIDLVDLFKCFGADMDAYNIHINCTHDHDIELYINDGPSGKYGNDYHICTLKNVQVSPQQKKELLRLVVRF